MIVTTPVAPREELDKMLAEHLAHQIKLEKQGIMFAAGPLTGEDGDRVGGMIVIRAESFAAARAIADSDPYHKAGLRNYTLTRWTVNEGSYGIRVNYSDQTVPSNDMPTRRCRHDDPAARPRRARARCLSRPAAVARPRRRRGRAGDVRGERLPALGLRFLCGARLRRDRAGALRPPAARPDLRLHQGGSRPRAEDLHHLELRPRARRPRCRARRRSRDAGKVAIIGFCWGGTLAWLSACRRRLCLRGRLLRLDDAGLRQRAGALPGRRPYRRPRHLVSAGRIAQFRAAQPAVPFYIYEGAQHGFDNANRTERYEPPPTSSRANARWNFWESTSAETPCDHHGSDGRTNSANWNARFCAMKPIGSLPDIAPSNATSMNPSAGAHPVVRSR